MSASATPAKPDTVTRQALIIDCDPGVDDAVALMLAFGSEAFELLAITAVGGNVPVMKTARNARILRQIAGCEDVPVFMGADRPLRREPAGAGEFHGAEGLGDMAPFEPEAPCADGHAADAMIDLVMARPARSEALAVLGQLTTLSLALREEPA
ncbi:MAG: nucleoside hydrolase, partial [bacterium]